jgi:hypothetical protein
MTTPATPHVSTGTDLPQGASALVERYFDLLYTNDITIFGDVFAEQAHLYGLVNGAPLVWPVAQYRDLLSRRESPKAQGAPRENEILAIDRASDTQAFAKVAVRVADVRFIDYLSMIALPQGWRIISKTYHQLP